MRAASRRERLVTDGIDGPASGHTGPQQASRGRKEGCEDSGALVERGLLARQVLPRLPPAPESKLGEDLLYVTMVHDYNQYFERIVQSSIACCLPSCVRIRRCYAIGRSSREAFARARFCRACRQRVFIFRTLV